MRAVISASTDSGRPFDPSGGARRGEQLLEEEGVASGALGERRHLVRRERRLLGHRVGHGGRRGRVVERLGPDDDDVRRSRAGEALRRRRGG